MHFSKARRESEATCQMSAEEVAEIIEGRLKLIQDEYNNHSDTYHMSDTTIKQGAFRSIK